MGVSGLLQALRPAEERLRVSDLRGQTLGVDGYGWLHRAATTCAVELVQGRATTRYLDYIHRRVSMFTDHGVGLYFVFDGAPLGLKARVDADRARRRAAARAKIAASPERLRDLAGQALDVTTEMAAATIAYLRARQIKFVVAPYEADPQLVHLERAGLVDAILSEDSDLLVFGARNLLTKLDRNGECVRISAARIPTVPLFRPLLRVASDDWLPVLRAIAIISGCDYSPGVTGYGVLKAVRLLYPAASVEEIHTEMVPALADRTSYDFAGTFVNAELAFQHQRVWDPRSGEIVMLTATAHDVPDMLAGEPVPSAHAVQIAAGKMCPIKRTPLLVTPCVAAFASRFSPVRPAAAALPVNMGRKALKVLGTQGREKSQFFVPRVQAPHIFKDTAAACSPQENTRRVPRAPLRPVNVEALKRPPQNNTIIVWTKENKENIAPLKRQCLGGEPNGLLQNAPRPTAAAPFKKQLSSSSNAFTKQLNGTDISSSADKSATLGLDLAKFKYGAAH